MLIIKIESEDPTQITLLINGKQYQYASTEQINSKFKWLLSKNKGRALSYLSKEAELLNRKDYDPNFHIELPEKILKEKDMDTITIQEEMRIPGTDVILEEGDRIEVLNELQQLDVAKEAIQKFIDENRPMPVADLKKLLRML